MEETMKFRIEDCEVAVGSQGVTVTHKPTGKSATRQGFATDQLKVEAMEELADVVEGRRASPKQLLTED